MKSYQKMASDNPDKYPKNMGKSWSDDEMLLLLEEVRQNKTAKEIATSHERTEGGIYAALMKQALSYHFDQRMPVNEILKLTRVSENNFQKAIKKDKRYVGKNSTNSLTEFFETTTEELIPTGRVITVKKKKTSEDESITTLLKDIKSLLQQLNEKIK
jgi:hypothetical protein